LKEQPGTSSQWLNQSHPPLPVLRLKTREQRQSDRRYSLPGRPIKRQSAEEYSQQSLAETMPEIASEGEWQDGIDIPLINNMVVCVS
jgi:hypothetical protein